MRKPYHHCIDCSKNIWTKGGRCRKCRNIFIKNHPEQHSTYIDGRKHPKCLDCGKEIIYGNKRCKKCYCRYKKLNGIIKGKNNGMWKGGLPKCKKCGRELVSYKAIYCKKCLWQIPEIKNKIIKSQRKSYKISPNKPEKCLNKLLNKLFLKEYKFVGNNKLVVGGFVPDFVNKTKNKIIEMFGDYWHTIKGAKEKDKRRLKTYKKYGYKTLIIWERELKNLNKVEKKILKFNKGD